MARGPRRTSCPPVHRSASPARRPGSGRCLAPRLRPAGRGGRRPPQQGHPPAAPRRWEAVARGRKWREQERKEEGREAKLNARSEAARQRRCGIGGPRATPAKVSRRCRQRQGSIRGASRSAHAWHSCPASADRDCRTSVALSQAEHSLRYDRLVMETVTLSIDGRQVAVEKGKTVLQAAIEAGISVPYYCYHPGIGVDGSCRVCVVKIEKMPKLQTSCSMVCTDGMVVSTRTPDVVDARAGIFEFLLVNHPLDCPVCDKGGECPLQDFSYAFGPDQSRMEFPRREFDGNGVTADVDFGPTLMPNRNR